MAFAATWMDLEVIMLSEVSLIVRQQHICYHLHVESKKKKKKKKDTLNFFAEQILTQQTLKNLWFPMETGQGAGGWAEGLGWKCYKIGL